MKSTFRTLMICAVMARLSFVSTVTDRCVLAATKAFYVVRDWAAKVFTGPIDMRRDAAQFNRPDPQLVRASSFVARILKRENPRVEAGWRMCPSI